MEGIFLETLWQFNTPGLHTIGFMADGSQIVRESSESNNQATSSVTVDQVQLYPDLTPGDIYLKGEALTEEAVEMTVFIMNQGGVTGTGRMIVWLDEQALPPQPVQLAPGKGDYFSFNFTAGEGLHTITVRIDSIHPEDLDGSNNEALTTIEVASASGSIQNPPSEPEPTPPVVIGVAAASAGLLALAAGGLAFTDWGRYRYLSLVTPLYSRIRKDKVLDHGTREALFNYITANPGEHLRQLAVSTSLPTGTLIHHLATLEREEYVKSIRDGVYKRFYPFGSNLDTLSSKLGSPQKKLLAHLKEEAGISPTELAKALGMSRQRIHYHLRNLVGEGLVRLDRDGPRSVKCFIAEKD